MATTSQKNRKRKRRHDAYRLSELNVLVRHLKRGTRFTTACKAAGLDPVRVREYMATDEVWAKRIGQPIGVNLAKAEAALFKAGTKPDGYGRLNERATMHYLTNMDPDNWQHRRGDTTTANRDGFQQPRTAKDLPPEKRRALQSKAKEVILADAKKREGEPVH